MVRLGLFAMLQSQNIEVCGRVAKRLDEFLIAENRSAKVRLGAAPLKSTRMRHPRLHLLSTRVSARMIYSANVFGTMKTAKESMGHPPKRHLPRQLGSA